MPFMEIAGPIVADTTYCEGKLSAKDTSFTLPQVSPVMADIMAMGTMSMPLWQVLEDMETTINKIGIDEGLSRMVAPKSQEYEFRWVQVVFDQNGNPRNVGCKAFIRGIPKSIPSLEATIGESPESEIPIATTRYRLIVDGKELWCIDRLANILRIDGVDYSTDINSML